MIRIMTITTHSLVAIKAISILTAAIAVLNAAFLPSVKTTTGGF